jgi:hypothetical protein
MVIRVVQRADAWLIEVEGDYYGPFKSEDAAFTHANLTALKLQMDDFGADIRIERRYLETSELSVAA